MREIIPRCSDEAYNVLETLDLDDIDSVSLQQALDMHPWLSDLLCACVRAVERNEFLRHNKSLSHIYEQRWLKQDCARYGVSVEQFLQQCPRDGSVRGSDPPIVEGVSPDDPEYDYMLSKISESEGDSGKLTEEEINERKFAHCYSGGSNPGW